MLDKLKELRRNAAAKKVSIGKDTLEDMEAADRAQALERQVGRKWKAGDVYAPHDLSPVESRKWKARRGPSRDVFDALGINPLNEYKVGGCAKPLLPSIPSFIWAGRGIMAGFDGKMVEFRHDVRIHDRGGSNQTFIRDGVTACESTQDRKGHQTSGRVGAHA